MDIFIQSLQNLCHFNVLVACAIGSVLGFVIGAIPGIGPAVGVALAIPFSLKFNPSVALTLFMGIYSGAEFGGCVSSIIMNVPGTGSAAATAFDGFPMAKKGRAVTAVSISTCASAMGGVLAPLILILMLPFLAEFIMYFGTPEFLLLGIMGIVCIAAVSKENILKGLMSGALGMMLCTIGIAPSAADQRYTFGLMDLFDGIDYLPAIIGLFGVAEMLKLIQSASTGISATGKLSGSRLEGVRLTLKNWKTVIKSSLIGLFIGLVPGVGGTTASFVSWAEAKRCSPHPEEFGEGCPAGVVATEASNNSVVSGSLMPTLLFGIPGSGTAAVILGGLMLHGLTPGRNLFSGDGRLLTEMLLISLILSSIFMLLIGLAVAPYLGKITIICKELLVPVVYILASLGIFAVSFSKFDVGLMLGFGVLGYIMTKANFPLFPLMLSLILGDMIEQNYLRSLALGKGSMLFMLEKPACLAIGALILLVVFRPFTEKLFGLMKRRLSKTKEPRAAG